MSRGPWPTAALSAILIVLTIGGTACLRANLAGLPCDSAGACLDGFVCQAGICIEAGTPLTPDGGVRDAGERFDAAEEPKIIDAGAPVDDAGLDAGAPDPDDGGGPAIDAGPDDGGVNPPVDAGLDAGVDAGCRPYGTTPAGDDGPFALYTFTEGAGATVFDRSARGEVLDLTISSPGLVEWIPEGLRTIQGSQTLIRSNIAAELLVGACQASGQMTLEAWITAEREQTDGNDRVLGVTRARDNLNAMIGHGGDTGDTREAVMVRMRLSGNDDGNPEVTNASMFEQLRHVVAVYDEVSDLTRVFLDGVEIDSFTANNSIAQWQTNHFVVVSSEFDPGDNDGAAHFFGVQHLAAIYCRALDDAEIGAHFAEGFALPTATYCAP